MNDQPLPSVASDPSVFSEGQDLPLPTIEPDMAELSAAIDNPVIDAPPAGEPVELAVLDLAPAPPASTLLHAQHLPEPQLSAQPSDGDLTEHVSRPISSVMEEILWTVHAEDSIERVQAILAEQNLSSAPVVGSNGAIIGMIGNQELAQFHADGKNAKAVQAWEIARIKTFEVSPGDSVEDVAKLMAENKVENISVTECGRLKGIVSTQDLLQDVLKVLPEQGEK